MEAVNILVVEDERIIALDLSQQLRALGYNVCRIVPSGQMAIHEAVHIKPDLVLMDIHLEGPMDGIEAAYQIHEQLRIPIIFLTAYAEDTTLERAKVAIPYGYLVKPIDPKELHAMIQMAMVRYGLHKDSEIFNDRVQKAMEYALIQVWEWRTSSSSLKFYDLLGKADRPLHANVSESLSDFCKRIDPRDIADVKRAFSQAQRNGDGLNVIFRSQHPSESGIRWMEAHAKGFREEVDEHDTRLVGILQDITNRRLIEEQLKQAHTVFNSTSEGILILDKALRIISVNPAFSLMTGYSLEEVQLWDSVFTLYKVSHSTSFFDQLHENQSSQWQGHVQYQCKNGFIMSVLETINCVGDQEDELYKYVMVFSDISSILASQEKLDFLAKHDPLTSLCNRRLFMDRLEQQIIHGLRNHYMVAVLLVDLDHFKSINDTMGHAFGDQLLCEVAKRMVHSVRSSDTVARLGGDEFSIILADLDGVSHAEHIARNVLEQLSKPFSIEQHVCYVTGSIGIAIAPDDGQNVSDLLRNADQAMYSAKHNGRNNFSFFAPFMQKSAEVRKVIAHGLHEALSGAQFWLAYQPIVDLQTSRIIKFEALLRWNHPLHGLIPPSAFIPIAEECGLIDPISDFVFNEVVRQLKEWRSWPSCSTLQVGINVSALHFRHPERHERWLDILQTSHIPGNALVLEITEGLLLDESVQVADALQQYHLHGVEIALDDFGTGYSALSYLKKFNLDFIKIDQSFVKNMNCDRRDQALCEAIIVMAHKLGLKVIAEGIETREQVDCLKQAGSDLGQGFYFSKPKPAQMFASLLQNNLVLPVCPIVED